MIVKINDNDKALINELRDQIKAELKLVPSYNDDLSLLRWLVGWDRKIDVVIPKIKASLRAISALGLDKQDLSSIDKINDYCDSISKPLQYLPGSLLGYDRDGNVVSLQMIGRLDLNGMLSCVKNSDLYVFRIAESEGVMNLIRMREKASGHQLGTTVIFDLEGLSTQMLSPTAIKMITSMLSQLQEMFPDVIRKIFIIRSPPFIQMVWTLISPCLAKQTKEKINFLGADWKDKLSECIAPSVLYQEWGGSRSSDKRSSRICNAGIIPRELRYDQAKDIADGKLKRLSVGARCEEVVEIRVTGGYNEKRNLYWWWRVEGGADLDFGIIRIVNEGDSGGSLDEDVVIVRPKFRLQTEFVPEEGMVNCAECGVYKLIFGNVHGKIWSKVVKYFVDIIEDDKRVDGWREEGKEDAFCK